MTKLLRQYWLETERGWGTRPDGYSVHKTPEDLKEFVKQYWDSMPNYVPDEYSRPTGDPEFVEVTQELLDRVEASEYGVRIY